MLSADDFGALDPQAKSRRVEIHMSREDACWYYFGALESERSLATALHLPA